MLKVCVLLKAKSPVQTNYWLIILKYQTYPQRKMWVQSGPACVAAVKYLVRGDGSKP